MPDLRPLDTIIHIEGGESYMVVQNDDGERAIAIRVLGITDPSQWLVKRSAPPEPTFEDGAVGTSLGTQRGGGDV